GRFTNAGRATIRLKGKMAGSDFVREIPVEFPETMASHDVLAPLWARARIDSLMGEDYLGAQRGTMRAGLKETITQLGIEYRLMTQFTSFVAVEEMIVTDGGQPRRIDVPVEVPEGVNRAAVFGAEQGAAQAGPNNFMLLRTAQATLTRSDRKALRSAKLSAREGNVGEGGSG